MDHFWIAYCTFPIGLYLCKSIGEVIMQSEFGLAWQDLGIRLDRDIFCLSVCRPSNVIAVSFMWVL